MFNLIIANIIIWSIAFWLKWNLPKLLGKKGERFMANKLEGLDPIKYRILNDIMIPSEGRTKTTQIDHVVVSVYGIFPIETKYYKGWIFGDAKNEKWTQVIYRYKKSFYNPLRQNYAHIKAIENIIHSKYPNIPIIGFIAIPAADKIQVTGTQNVGLGYQVIEKIKAINKEVISIETLDEIVKLLQSLNIEDEEKRKEHIKEVSSIKKRF